MLNTFSNISVINLTELTFIAGTYTEISMDIYNASGSVVDLTTWTCTWVLCPFGQPNAPALVKTATFRTDIVSKNRFTVYLYSTDTISLSGKYIQQPIFTASIGYDFRPGQGYINILPALATS